MQQPIWNFEQEPWDELYDETSINLRSYFDKMPEEKMAEYRPEWSDDELRDWDGNFKDEGDMLLSCSERDIEIEEYRRVLEQAIAYRDRVRPTLVPAAT